MGLFWYVLQSKPRKEVQVHRYLLERDIEVFFPHIHVRPANPRSSPIRPYFARYLFIQVDFDTLSANTLRWMPGVLGLVEFGGEPAIIPDNYIYELRRRLASLKAVEFARIDDFKRGEPVTITSGPFEGHEAIFDMRLSGEDRAQVLLHWLGRQVRVTVSGGALRRKPARPAAG